MADQSTNPNDAFKAALEHVRSREKANAAFKAARERVESERAPSPGTAGYGYVNIDKTEPGIVEADALESLTNEFIQTRGMNVVDARKEATRKLNEMRIADEGAAETTRAKSAKLAAETPDMTTYGVGVRTFGTRVVPESQLGMSPGERDQAWREKVAANEAGLGGGMERLRKVASSLAEAEAPPMSEADAREAGIVRPWMDKIHTGLARMANAAMDLDGDEAVVGAHELWDGIAGYAEDKDVQTVVSASGAADIAKRAYMKSGLPDVVVSAKEAATMTAADTARAIDLDKLAERIERVGVSRADAQRAHQYIMDAQPLPDFDAVGDQLVKQPEEIAIDSAWEASAHMTPAEVPDRDVAGHFKVGEWRERLAQNEATRANPEFAAAWDAIDKGMDDGRLEWALRSVSYGSLREVDPSFGPKGIDLVNLAKRRESARLATGGKASGSMEKILTAALIGGVTNDAGETVYVERTTGQIMRIAGTFAEGVYESDLKLGDSIAFWQVPMLAAVADMAGAEDLGRKIRNVRVPTKAGLDQMAQTGYYDDVYYSLGLTRPRALRVKNETTSSPRETLARVFANVQDPAFQGPGYTDAYVRAGGNPIDGIAQSLSFVDVAIDFANPIDDFMFDAGGQLVRRPSRAAAAASVAAPGMRKVAAVTAAFPEAMLGKAKRAAVGAADVMKVGKDTDTDAVLRDIVLAETRRMINEGEAVDLTAFESPEFDDAARSIGVDSTMLRDEVVKAIEFSRGRVLTRAKQMLDNGVTPEVEALRKTPTWARRKAEVDALVAANLAPGDARSFTPEKADMMMRWEEAMALASADIGTPFVTKGNPEQYLGRQGRVVGGTSGPGAYFQGAADIEAKAPGISELRERMLAAAGDDTAFDAKTYAERKKVCKLTGHCNAAAYVVQKTYGGDLLSAKVNGETHVWNRLVDGTEIDLTGSQYGGDGFHPVATKGKVVPPRATVNPRFKEFERRVGDTSFNSTTNGKATGQGTIERVGRQTDTPEFKTWFGDSKVVDEKGAPLVVYHGTRHDFSTFSDSADPAYGKWYSSGFYFTDKPEVAEAYATSFRPSKSVTEWAKGEDVWSPDDMEGANVAPVYVSIKNPYVWPEGQRASLKRAVSFMNPERLPEDLHDAVFARLGVKDIQELKSRWSESFTSYQIEAAQAALADAVRDELRARGYDGIVVHNLGDKKRINGSERGYKHDEYIAFDPEQIKSAIGNRGTFDPRDPNILHSTIGGKQTEQGTIERVVMPVVREKAPTFYSALRRTVADIKQERLTAEQLRGMLAKAPGVKADEIEWTRLDDFLREHPKPTKTEVLNWLDENAVVVEEKRLGGDPQAERNALFERAEELDHYADESEEAAAELDRINERLRSMPPTVEADNAEPPRYANYQLPGGTNYREVLFKMPEEQSPASLPPGWLIKRESFGTDIEGETAGAEFVVYGPDGDVVARGPTDRAALRAAEEATGESLAATTNDVEAARYQAPHFGDEGANLLAHTRLSDRVGPNGEKILHVEEIQSDADQKLRDLSNKIDAWDNPPTSPAELSRVRAKFPHPPTNADRAEVVRLSGFVRGFAGRTHELVMKRILREAAENGYDGVTWTTGVQQVKRYEDATRRAVDEIRWRRAADALTPDERAEYERLDVAGDNGARFAELDRKAGTAVRGGRIGDVEVIGSKNGREVYRETMPPEKVADVLGKGMAAKIAESTEASGSLTGADLTIGGEGMKGFYDQMLPSFVQKYVKKWGGRVGQTTLEVKPPLRESERAMGSAEWARDYEATSREPVHYLPLTPQMRDAILYEGQPLFQRVNGQIRGSIERPAQTVGWLQRYYSGANADTVFHENGHGTRFIFGDDWTDELARHFDHTIDPQTNRPVLTRKGEEQAAEAWRWYQRTKMNPDGTVQGLFDVAFIALDRFWFAMRNKLAGAPDAPTLPGGLAAYWDALLNPGARAQRAAIAIGDASLPRFVDTVRASDDPAVNVVAATAERAGKTRQMTRIDALPDDIRAEIGVEEGIVEMDPVELYARLLAKVTVDKYKSRGWGSEPYVRIGSTRTAVPQSRVKRILDDVTAKKVQAFGAKAPPVKGNVLDLDPNQRAGLAGLINEIKRSPLGNTLPERIRSFDPLNPTATFAVADMKIVDDALVDIHAGANARRSYAAENLVSAPMVTKVLRLFSDTVTDAEVYRNAVTKMQSYFSDKLINAFGATGMEKYAGPALRELVEEMRREMGQVSSDVTGEMMQNTSAGNRLRIRFLQDAVGKETSVIDPLRVDSLDAVRSWFLGNIGDVGARGHAQVDVAVTDLFDPSKKVNLNTIEAELALAPHAGGVGLTPLESGAVQALRGNEAARLVAGVDVPTWLAQPGNAETISDALGILQRGTKLRWAAFMDEAKNLLSAGAGSNDSIVMTAINDDLAKSFYRDFWEASDDSWERMFSILTDLGQKVSGPSFNQSQAVLAMIMRLRVRRIFNRLGERLLAAGIAISPDIALTLNIKRGASYVDEIGHHGMFGFDGERQRVHDVLNQMVGWKERPITKGHHTGTTWVPTGSVTPGKIDVSTPEGRRAYTIGTRVLAALGWQFGKGSFGDGLVMLPNGQELYMPEMMAKYIVGTMDETAKLGGAFAGAMRGGWLSDSWNTLSKAVAKGEEAPAYVLNLSGVDADLGQLTTMPAQQLAAKSRRETAQAAGVTAGAIIGAALAGWPGGIVGGIAGRNIVPHAIEAGGSLAAKWRRSTGALGGATGAVGGSVVGTVIGAVKTVSDALSVLYPITMGMSRVGMTAGLIVPHAAFYVANVFGATFQTYLRTGLRGVARTAKQFLPWFGEPAMIGRVLSDMADWNNVAQLLPDPKPFLTDAGGIWTYEMLIDAVKRVGLDSSFVKSQSTNQLANVMRSLFGDRWEKFKAHPFDTAAEPFGYVQNGLMELASAVDNANRVGVFIAELKRGVGVEEAGKIAREAAFDYGNLSEFERTVLRPVVLFYSYLRQSVGLFWNTAITNPGRIIGALRASRGLRYDEAEEPDITLPESLDTKLLLAFEGAKAQGHANQGVATVSPPMTVDVFPLYAEILGLFTGDSDDWRKVVIGHLDPTFQFITSVGPYGIDPFSGMNVDEYNTVPGWLVDMDRDLTGGLLYDMLDIHEMQQSDPSKADYPGAPRFQAGNGKLWWFLRNKVQVPPFGRYLDEMSGYDRWAPLGGAGPVTAAVKAAHAYRESGGNPALDAFFAGPVRRSIAWMPGIGFDINRPMVKADTNVEVVEDVMTPRDDVSRTKEGLNVLGVKTVVVPNLENVDARGVTTSMRAMEDAKKTAEKTDDTRYQ